MAQWYPEFQGLFVLTILPWYSWFEEP